MFASSFVGVIGQTLGWGFSSTFQAPAVSTIAESFTTTLMSMLPLFVFAFFALIGFLYTLKIKNFKTLNIYGWTILLFVFATVFLGLNSFLPARWFIYIQICLIVPVAISILSISQTTSKKLLVIFLIITMFSFVGLTNYQANALNVNPFTPYPTGGIKYSEDNVGIFNEIPNNIKIYTDLGYHNPNFSNRTWDASDILSGNSNLDGILLFRTDLESNPFFSSALGGGQFSIQSLKPSFLPEMQNYDRVYDSGTVIGFDGNP